MDDKRWFGDDVKSWLYSAAWLPCFGFALAIGVLAILKSDLAFNPPYLLFMLNLTFLTAVSFSIFVLAGNTYLISHSRSMLFLACGVLALGLGAALAAFPFAGRGANWTVTVYNTSACIAAVFHLTSAIVGVSHRPGPGSCRTYAGFPVLALAVLAIVTGECLLIALAANRQIPVYFVDGQGATGWNKAVLWSSAAMFGAAALLFLYRCRRERSRFACWYGLGLALIAMGLAGVSMQARLGDPLNWTSRSSQYVGGVYLLIAALVAARPGGRWRMSLKGALHEIEQRYQTLDQSARFAYATINALSANICVLDQDGEIIAVNKAWRDFASANGCNPDAVSEGANYLRTADEATGDFSAEAAAFAEGIRTVLRGESDLFMLEYPCHSPDKQRWFVGRATLFHHAERKCVVVAHEDVTARKQAEEALRESEERYRGVVETTEEGIATHAPDGTILYVNQRMADILGYSPEEIVGKSSVIFADKEQRQAVIQARDSIKEKGAFRAERKLCRKDGSIIWTLCSVSPRRDANGNFIGYLALHADITDRKQAEEALRDALDEALRFRQALDLINSHVYIKDLDSRYVYANQLTLDLFGCSAEELPGSGDERFFPPETVTFLREIDLRVFSGEQTEEEVDIRHADGTRRVYWEVKTPLYASNDTAVICGLLGISTDITERKQAEAALRANEDRYRAVVQDQTEIIARFLIDGTVIFVNDACCRFYGNTAEELIGNKWQQKAIPEDVPHVEEQLKRLNPTNPIVMVENRVVSGMGQIHWMQFANRGFFDADGHLVEIQCVGRDITDRKQTEELLRNTEAYARGLIEASVDALVTIGPDGKITDVNRSTEEMTGLSREELIGSDFSEYFTEPEVAQAGYRQVFRNGMVRDYALHLRHRDGHITPVHYNASVYCDASGNVAGVFAAARDITELHRREGELREANRALNELIVNSPLAIVALDSEGLVRIWNPAAMGLFGWSETEVLGRLTPIVPQEEADAFRLLLMQELEGRCEPGMELNRRRKDGSSVAVQLWTAPLRDAQGNASGVLGMFVDLTERKQMQHVMVAQRDLAVALNHSLGLSDTLRLCLETAIAVSNTDCGGIYLLDPLSGQLNLAFALGLSAEFVECSAHYEKDSENARLVMRGSAIYGRHSELGLALSSAELGEGLKAMAVIPTLHNGLVIGCVNVASHVVDDVSMSSRAALETIAGQVGSSIYRSRTEEALVEHQRRLQLLTRRLAQSEEAERRRIAVQLHDHVGQSLAAIRVRLDAWKVMESPVQRESVQSNIESLIDGVIDDIRSLTFELSPPILYELGLGPALERLGEGLCKNVGIAFEFQDDGSTIELGTELASELYRTVRELIVNALKHARPSRVSVSLAGDENNIRVMVADDGSGFSRTQFDCAQNGLSGTFGLFSIRERLREFDGCLELESHPGAGTCMTVVVARPRSIASAGGMV